MKSYERMRVYEKDPDAILDYPIDWAGDAPGPYLTAGVTIVTAAWTVPDGITKVTDSKTATTTTIVLKDGVVGTDYLITCHAVLSNGLEDDRSIEVQVRER